MTILVGNKSYLFLADENEWGHFPGQSGSNATAAVYYMLPVNSYTVGVQRRTRQPQPFTGLHSKKAMFVYGHDVSGQLVAPLYGYHPSVPVGRSLAEKLMDWAFEDWENVSMVSRAAEWAVGPNTANRRHTGLRVNTATLVGSADSGDVMLTLDLIGQQEFAGPSAQTIPNDLEKLSDMQFVDCTFTLAGTVVAASGFQWTRNNNLMPLRLNSQWITELPAGDRDETLQITIPKETATYDLYQRLTTSTEITGQITLQGLHNGTGSSGSYTKLTAAFNRLAFLNRDLPTDRGILMEPLTFQVLKPDSSSQGTTLTWSEV